jgi:hypothetical protein
MQRRSSLSHENVKGDITIQINNIKSGAAAAARGAHIDSVKFTTQVS